MLAYLKVLLRNWLAGYKPKILQHEGHGKARAVFSYVGFTILAIFLYAMVILLEMLVYEACNKMGEPQAVIALALLGCTAVTLFYSFFYVVSTLFFGKDNAFVAALPISSHGVLAAKLCMVVVGELGLTLLIAAPLLLRFGIETGAGVLYYMRAFAGTLFVPLVPIAVSTLLSFVLIRLSALWKRREGMTTIFSFVLMIAVMTLQMNLSMHATNEKVDDLLMGVVFGQASITNLVLNVYLPLRWLTDAITGSGVLAWGNLALFIGLSIAVVAIIIFLCGKAYMRLALKQEETFRRINMGNKRAKGAGRVHTPFWAFYRQEMRDVIKVPVYATNCLTGTILFPTLIVIMILNIQSNMPDMTIFVMLQKFISRELYLVLAVAGLTLTTIVSMAVSTAVSREGKGHVFRRTFPVSGGMRLKAKLLMGMTYNAITMFFSAIVLWVLIPIFWLETLIALALSQLFSMMISVVSLISDVYHPRLNWKNETEAVKQNMNAMLSMLIGICMLAALVGLFFLCMNGLHLSIIIAFAVVILVVAFVDYLLMKWLCGKVSMTYCLREYAK